MGCIDPLKPNVADRTAVSLLPGSAEPGPLNQMVWVFWTTLSMSNLPMPAILVRFSLSWTMNSINSISSFVPLTPQKPGGLIDILECASAE
jgi:hypothetical protein